MTLAQDWIQELGLRPHPEGGFYRETHRTRESIGECCLSPEFSEPRSVATAIYYLLNDGAISRLHRIRSDEVWHHYAGEGLSVHVFGSDGTYRELLLGTNPSRGEEPQRVVPAMAWFGATLSEPSSYCLAGCTVAPGFHFQDLEIADRATLLEAYPNHRAVIERLTVESNS